MKTFIKHSLIAFMVIYCTSKAYSQTPTVPASNIITIGTNTTYISINWTSGNGTKRIVTCAPYGNAVSLPNNGWTYTANSSYGSGSNLGNSNYVVYNSTSTGTTIFGLTAGAHYTIRIFEYNTVSTVNYYLTGSYPTYSEYTLSTEPTTQASSLNASNITTTTALLSFTTGNGTYDLVSLRNATAYANVPVDGTSYSASSTYGAAGIITGTVPYCAVMYNSTSFFVNASGLTAGNTYTAAAFAFNGASGSNNYLTSTYPTKTFTTLANAPTTSSSTIAFNNVTNNSMTVSWTVPSSGGGTYHLVTCKAGTTNADLPVDGTYYTASTSFGSGTQIGGATGAYVVYNNNGNYVNVTGLSTTTNYCFSVYEYNIATNTYNYTGNYLTTGYLSGYKQTLSAEPTTPSTNLIFSNKTSNSVRVTWANGNGTDRVVGVRAGRLQTALSFDGLNDYVSIPNESNFDFTTAMTVEAWIKVNTFTLTDQTIISKGDNSWRLQRNGSSNNLQFALTIGGAVHYVIGGRNVNDGEWHHIAGMYDGSLIYLYIDGTLDGYTAASGSIDNSSYPVYIGENAQSTGRYFKGQIDEVRIWNYATGLNYIKSNINKTLVGSEYGLVGYWKLDEGYATSATAKNSAIYTSSVDGTLTGFSSTAAATNFNMSSGWVLSGAQVNVPLDYGYYYGTSAFMSMPTSNSGYYYGGFNTFVVYKGSDSTSVTVTGLSPATYYNFGVFDYNGASGTNNYLTDSYLTADVVTNAMTTPTITAINPAFGPVGTQVTITGTNFNTTAANNAVYFGAAKATVLSATATSITVKAPSGTTFEPVSVTNNSLTAYHTKPFVLTSSCGTSNFSATSYNASSTVSNYWSKRVKVADMDLDGLPDVIGGSLGYTAITRNTSTSTAVSFAASYTGINLGNNSIGLATADFDGDGKTDVCVGHYYNGNSSIVVTRNQSSVANIFMNANVEFAGTPTYTVSDIAVADFDKDGKPDILMSYANNVISVFRNISSTGYINFEAKVDIAIGATAVINAIATGDLDGDGKTDVALACGSGNLITYLRNTSTPGNISCAAYTTTALASSVQGIAIGDIDSDTKMDIVIGYGTNQIGVLKNNSTLGSISISGTPTYSTALSNTPSDIKLGDLDGDGKADIIAGYSSGTQVSIFKNSSTATFSIGTKYDFTLASSTSNPLAVAVCDMNGDSKADLLSTDNGVNISFFQNNINALANEPSTASTNLTFTGINTTQVTVNWTAGNGANRIVVARLSTSSAIPPNDAISYVPNSVFGSGTHLGAGNYVVYDGNSNSVTVTGLQSNTAYTFAVYEYNGTTQCQNNYLIGGASSSATQTTNNTPPTLAAISNPTSVCQNSGTQSVNLSGIGSGSGTESQTLVVTATSGNTALVPNPIITYTSPNTTGSLAYTVSNGVWGTAVITVKVNDGASNNNITTQTFTITVDHFATVSAAGADQQICPDVATLSGNTPAYGTGLWTIQSTTNGAITLTDATNPTTTVNNFAINDSVTLKWTISNGSCTSSQDLVKVKRKSCPTTADFTASSTAECLNGTPAVTFTDASIGSGATITSWSWSFGAGASPATANTQGPHTVIYSTAGPKHISLTVIDNLSATDNETKFSFVSINDVPDPAGNVSGTTTVCQGQSGVSYSVPAINNATGYTWNLPSGAVINSGTNTNTITVDYGTVAVSGNITVRGTNACGNGTLSANFPVTINPLPANAGTITGPSSVCDGATGVTYSVPAIANATSYNWTVPNGSIIMSGSTTNTITVNFIAGSAGGTISVYGISCGNGVASSMNVAVNQYPGVADVITGQTSITTCPATAGVTYSIPLVTDATGYNWTVPSGAAIVSGSGTNAITVDYSSGAASGNITVMPVNSCGNGTSSSLPITVNTLPDMAGNISGNDSLTICPLSNGIIYSVAPIFNASSYVWSIPSGASITSGTGTNTITVDYGNTTVSGIISVYGQNSCGIGSSSSIAVDISTVPTQELCMVSVDDNSTYNKITWEKPTAADIDSFRIYREVLGSFVPIGSVAYSSLSEYTDSIYLPLADPNTTNFRYKISVIDTCGNESVVSNHHRTIFLQANQGVGGVVNLNWVPYEGASVSFYRILRDTLGTGAFVAIDSVPGANTVYTDLAPPANAANIGYLLESNWATTCTPTRATINTTRSNIKHVGTVITGNQDQEILDNVFNLFPNPAGNEVTIEYPVGFKKYQLQLFDALGQIVYNEQLNDAGSYNGILSHKIDVSSFHKGIYIVSVGTESGNTFKRLIIQ